MPLRARPTKEVRAAPVEERYRTRPTRSGTARRAARSCPTTSSRRGSRVPRPESGRRHPGGSRGRKRRRAGLTERAGGDRWHSCGSCSAAAKGRAGRTVGWPTWARPYGSTAMGNRGGAPHRRPADRGRPRSASAGVPRGVPLSLGRHADAVTAFDKAAAVGGKGTEDVFLWAALALNNGGQPRRPSAGAAGAGDDAEPGAPWQGGEALESCVHSVTPSSARAPPALSGGDAEAQAAAVTREPPELSCASSTRRPTLLYIRAAATKVTTPRSPRKLGKRMVSRVAMDRLMYSLQWASSRFATPQPLGDVSTRSAGLMKARRTPPSSWAGPNRGV